MRSVLWIILVLAFGQAIAAAQTTRMSPAECDRIVREAYERVQQGGKITDCARMTRMLQEAWGMLQQLSPECQKADRVSGLRWRLAYRLGLFRQARAIFEDATDDQQEEMLAEWKEMQNLYGSASLSSPDEMVQDPTLDVVAVRIEPLTGTSSQCPFDEVRARAAREVVRAYEARDLVTNPIILPVGRHALSLQLDRESALNYVLTDTKTHSQRVEFEIQPDNSGEVEEIRIAPERTKAALPVLAGLVAVLVTPFLLAK
ncbi:MAG: hypothetical protein KBD56_01470 [Candidatus Eisenbacteria bacterium]|nr:hypothetical protein [Candidatus Eisenbacteria bacterium]